MDPSVQLVLPVLDLLVCSCKDTRPVLELMHDEEYQIHATAGFPTDNLLSTQTCVQDMKFFEVCSGDPIHAC